MSRSTVAGLCPIIGVFLLWLVSRSSVRSPWLVLGLFALGILLGVVAGVLFGLELRDRLRKRKHTVLPFIVLAVFNLVVFTLLGKPLPTGLIGTYTLAASITLPVLTALLVALNAYLLGFLVIPGRNAVSRSRGIRWIILLYSSILIGVVLGFESGLWQLGTVPLEPLRQREPRPPPRRVTLEELFRESEAWFPPKITVEEIDPEWISFMAPVRGELEILPSGKTFEATGAVAVVDGHEAKILGYAMLPPNPPDYPPPVGGEGEANPPQREPDPATFWAPDGTPLDQLPHFHSEPGDLDPWDYTCMFCLSVPGDWSVASLPWPTVSRFPWEKSRAWGLEQHEGILWTQHRLKLPIPFAAELRVRFYKGARTVTTIPAREGEALTLARNRAILVRVLPWEPSYRSEPETLYLKSSNGGKARSGSDTGPAATAVFYCVKPQFLGVEAVLHSGETVRSMMRSYSGGWVAPRFRVSMDRIKEFRILEEPETFEVVFHLPEVKGFPPENEGVTNRLDMFYPRLMIQDPPISGGHSALGGRLAGEFPRPHGLTTQVTYDDVTVRDVLDIHYPGRWWVSNGVVLTTNERFGPIAWKVRQAWKGIGDKR